MRFAWQSLLLLPLLLLYIVVTEAQSIQPCSNGLAGYEASGTCCPLSCGACDGSGCSQRGDGCCTSDIRDSGDKCSVTKSAPCNIDTDTVDTGGEACPGGIPGINANDVVCCPSSCGQCGGSGCSSRPGGAASCCGPGVQANYGLCSVTGKAPCAIEASGAGSAFRALRGHDEDRPEVDIGETAQPVTQTKVEFPSPRCQKREEWQGMCRVWSGRSHHRYLELDGWSGGRRSREGIGSSLRWVKWSLDRAISFDLEPIFIGPIIAGHGVGNFGNTMGITNNPLFTIHDPEAFASTVRERVPFPEGLDDAWFREQDNTTSVVFNVDVRKITVSQVTEQRDWGMPASPSNPNSRVCRYARQAFRDMYWSAPRKHGRCRGFLPDDYNFTPERNRSRATMHLQRKRSWVLAVHVRRGDVVRIGKRVTPHSFFSTAVKGALRGIAATDPAAHVFVLVFSQASSKLGELQLPDEHGKAITWDIERESCHDIGVSCSQKIFLEATAIDTFDCLAAADVVVGSKSSFSEAAAAVSTNVKFMAYQNQTQQDRVTLNAEEGASSATVGLDEQLQMNAAIADWWHCSEEARQSIESNAASLGAGRFYQTVEERG